MEKKLKEQEERMLHLSNALGKEREERILAIKEDREAIKVERAERILAIKEEREERVLAIKEEREGRILASKEELAGHTAADEQIWGHLGETVGRVEDLQMWATTQVWTTCVAAPNFHGV